MRQSIFSLALVACVCLSFAAVSAADVTPGTPPAGGGAGGAGGGRGNPADWQKQREERTKTALGVNDEEYKALQPLLDAVRKARMDASGFGGFGGGRGGRGGQQADTTTEKTEMQKKTEALKTLVDNKESDPKALQDALKAFRDERDKSRQALKDAQAKLKEVLTAKQEAYMVLTGSLE